MMSSNEQAAQSRRTGVALVLLAGTIFSFTPLLFRAASPDVGPWQFLAWRAISAATAMLVWLVVRHGRRAGSVLRSVGQPELVAGLVLAAAFTLYILALDRVSTALVLFIQAVAPFVAAFLGWVILRERVERATVISMMLALVGIAIMVGFGFGEQDRVGLVLCGALSIVVGSISVAMRRATDADPAVVPLIGTVAAALVAIVIAGLGAGLFFGVRDIVLAALAGGFLLGLGLPLYTGSHRSVPAAVVPLLLLSEIILSPVWVWIWHGETPATSTLVGGAVVLLAVVWLTVASANHDEVSST